MTDQKDGKRKATAWSIASERGLIHTNWLLGRNGLRAWAGADDRGLFATRREAREMLVRLRPALPWSNTWRVVKVTLEWNR